MRHLLWLLLFLPAISLASSPEVQAILGEKVVVVYKGERLTLSKGEARRGLKLLSVEGEQVSIELDGRRNVYRLGERRSMSTQFSDPKAPEIRLKADQMGMYHASGRINSHSVRFLVDTGATLIALNSSDARRLGIDFRREGTKIWLSTASKQEMGYRVTLDKVQVGGITLYNVAAVVMDNRAFPQKILLGMSFLSSLEMSRNGDSMLLKRRW